MSSSSDEKKINAPLYQALLRYCRQQPARFHIPGHKGGRVFEMEGASQYRSLLEIDVTELTELDDLHHPQGVIAEAQRLAAEVFHADSTYFLVNGSTSGNAAMILGTLRKGDRVLVQRNSHKSIFHALALREVEAIFVEPELCSQFFVPVGLSLDKVKQAFERYKGIRAIILTSPNYYGMVSEELKEMFDYAHEHHALVLVDEAHGAHFGQHAQLPSSVMQLGADISVQSTHKMLSSLTMTSMLHIQGARVEQEDIEYYLHSLQSSSPSYPLMASLDLARAQLQGMTVEIWERTLRIYEQLRTEINQLGSYKISETGKPGKEGIHLDPLKLIIHPLFALSGYDLQTELEKRNVYVEMADPNNILLTLPLIPNHAWHKRLVRALQEISPRGIKPEKRTGQHMRNERAGRHMRNERAGRHMSNERTGQHMRNERAGQHMRNERTGRHMSNERKQKLQQGAYSLIRMKAYFKSDKEQVPIEEAVGKIAGEMITPYPPGIPLLIHGECITEHKIRELTLLQEAGAYFQGKEKGFQRIQILREYSSYSN